jgi:hypothetical protein
VTTVCVVSTAGYKVPVLQYSRKVRPRTSAWYSLHVDATRQNVILPDLPQYTGTSYQVQWHRHIVRQFSTSGLYTGVQLRTGVPGFYASFEICFAVCRST